MKVLVLIKDATSVDVIKPCATIIHTLSPRLYVVSAEPEAIASLAKLADVIAVTGRVFPESVLRELDPSETLFATAFAASNTQKIRKGEGMEWDAHGFTPPDAPPENTRNKTRKLKPKTNNGGERNDPEN